MIEAKVLKKMIENNMSRKIVLKKDKRKENTGEISSKTNTWPISNTEC